MLETPPKRPESLPLPEALPLTDADQIREYFKYADGVLGVGWDEEGPPEEYLAEYIASHPDEVAIIAMRDEKGEIMAAGRVQLLHKEDVRDLGLGEHVGALLEYQVVREDLRNQDLGRKITESRLEWAKERGAELAITEVELENPISIYAKVRDGFRYVGVAHPEGNDGGTLPYLIAVRELDGELSTTTSERRELAISVDAFGDLKELFDDGWMGTEARLEPDGSAVTLVLTK